jgi:hypothetical protein
VNILLKKWINIPLIPYKWKYKCKMYAIVKEWK